MATSSTPCEWPVRVPTLVIGRVGRPGPGVRAQRQRRGYRPSESGPGGLTTEVPERDDAVAPSADGERALPTPARPDLLERDAQHARAVRVVDALQQPPGPNVPGLERPVARARQHLVPVERERVDRVGVPVQLELGHGRWAGRARVGVAAEAPGEPGPPLVQRLERRQRGRLNRVGREGPAAVARGREREGGEELGG